MKEFTRKLRDEIGGDLHNLYHVNNSKDRKRTEEQRRQSKLNKCAHYKRKWETYLEQCETVAQKRICNTVLWHIEKIM